MSFFTQNSDAQEDAALDVASPEGVTPEDVLPAPPERMTPALPEDVQTVGAVSLAEVRSEALLGSDALARADDASAHDEAWQVEEILRLEREMERLRRRKEETERGLGAESLLRLQRLREDIDAQASRAAQHFLHALNFHEIDECVRSIETHAHTHTHSLGREEDDVDEGLGADDSPNPSETGQSDGQRTSGIRSGDDSEEEELYANECMAPPTHPHAANPNNDSTYCSVLSREGEGLIPPDEESEDEDVAMTTWPSLSHVQQWPPVQRVSIATSSSSGAQYYSSETSVRRDTHTHTYRPILQSHLLYIQTHAHT